MGLQTTFPGPSGLADSTMIRKDLAGLILRDTSGNARPGIFPRTSAAIASVVAGTWTLSIAKFEGCSVRGGGPLFLNNDGAATTPANTSQAPGANSRVDILYAVQHESASPYGDADNLTVYGWVYGTPGASPVKNSAGLAAIPGAVELLTVQVPSTATSFSSAGVTVTETYQFTALAGQSFRVRTASDLTALTSFDTGQRAVAQDTQISYRWNGTTWKGWDSDWITFTPTITNLVVGTGGSASSVWAYKFVAGDVKVKFSLVLGTSGASVSGIPTITLPVARAALAHAYEGTTGFLVLYDTANTRPYQGAILAENTDATKVRLVPTNSGALTTAIAAGVPFTWVPGSAASGELSYKAA